MAREKIPFQSKTRLPVVVVEIGWSQAEEDELTRHGVPLPPEGERRSLPMDALVDSGSHRSFIPEEIAVRLRLARVGEGPVTQSLGGRIVVPFYAARLTLVPRQGIKWQQSFGLAPTIQVGVLPSNGDRTRVLPMPIIGRDVLDTCVFRYNGPGQVIEFEPQVSRPKKK